MNDVQVLTRTASPPRIRFAPPARRRTILVVGMSRSGTSLTTHVLNTLGVALPADLLEPGFGNPLGFWEPSQLVAMNDRILEQLGRSTDDPRPIDPDWFRSRAAYETVRQLASTIDRLYPDDSLFAIKDPRICRLLPLYLEALDILDIEPLIILQVRHAAESAESLSNMEGIDAAAGQFLWLRSLADAELYSRRCQRVWISYDGMLANWRDTVERIADQFALHWPLEPEAVAPDLDRIVKPRLRHVCCAEAAAWAQHPLIAAAWEAVSQGVRGRDPDARAGFDAVRSTMREMDLLYLPAMTGLFDRHVRALEAVRTSTSWRVTAPLRWLKQLVLRISRVRRGLAVR